MVTTFLPVKFHSLLNFRVSCLNTYYIHRVHIYCYSTQYLPQHQHKHMLFDLLFAYNYTFKMRRGIFFWNNLKIMVINFEMLKKKTFYNQPQQQGSPCDSERVHFPSKYLLRLLWFWSWIYNSEQNKYGTLNLAQTQRLRK